jgi:hypothetical protein
MSVERWFESRTRLQVAALIVLVLAMARGLCVVFGIDVTELGIGPLAFAAATVAAMLVIAGVVAVAARRRES